MLFLKLGFVIIFIKLIFVIEKYDIIDNIKFKLNCLFFIFG